MNQKMKYAKIIGLCIGLSSNILGCSFGAIYLEKNGYISNTVSMMIILGSIFINFYWIIRYAIKKSN
ncbi:MAG: hypothetical protein N4A33_09225 [Bacteriovoracaceae bacterium]|jgi:hypothetical protein|nr:hypothetical protein [Bacteriovoracaceae bacterium]